MLSTIKKLLKGAPKQYQEKRYPREKFELLHSAIKLDTVKNLLDIGCNAGVITHLFAEKGLFSVGIDVAPRLINRGASQIPVIGYFKVSNENVSSLPDFDAVLLLSVHHQWVIQGGDKEAQHLVAAILLKARKYFFIEFASINSKYGYSPARFKDHDEESILKYARDWLQEVVEIAKTRSATENISIRYVGKNKELERVEEFRYVYLVSHG